MQKRGNIGKEYKKIIALNVTGLEQVTGSWTRIASVDCLLQHNWNRWKKKEDNMRKKKKKRGQQIIIK